MWSSATCAAGSVGVGVQNGDAVSHIRRGDGDHSAELTSADDADARAGRQRRVRLHQSEVLTSLSARTSSAAARRRASSLSRRSGLLVAIICAANRPAFTAPARPIATVATGTPRGICTIDSRESRPFRAALSTGTPMTGNIVFAATMPGKWAAPARTCDDHLEAPVGRRLCVLEHGVGGAMRGDDAHLVVNAEFVENVGGVPHGFEVRPAAHDHAYHRIAQESRSVR